MPKKLGLREKISNARTKEDLVWIIKEIELPEVKTIYKDLLFDCKHGTRKLPLDQAKKQLLKALKTTR